LLDVGSRRSGMEDRFTALLGHVTAATIGKLQDQRHAQRDEEQRDQRRDEEAERALGDGDLAQERQRQAKAERPLSKEQLPQLRFAQNLSPVPRRPDESESQVTFYRDRRPSESTLLIRSWGDLARAGKP
jgi:hypothetical protein